jgi:adenylyltransferase/sulfurtransferase
MPHVTGVVGALAGLIGMVQAYEALKHILGAGELLNGRLLYIDALVNDYATYKYGRIPDCPVCGD